jgi:very-long-chain enoyl-CoA reductase
MKVLLVYRDSAHELDLPATAKGSDLINLACNVSSLPVTRVRIVYDKDGKNAVVTPDQLLADLSVPKYILRDLGPQFSYFGVFLIEYLGPLLIWPFLALVLRPAATPYFVLASIMWILHYVKRILETIFVHTFSRPTMPLRNVFKNSAYYWGFATAIVICVANRDGSVGLFEFLCFGGFFVCEVLNFYCHIHLRNLRPKGSVAHVLPKGFLFDQIACPNYTTEILAWTCFAGFVKVIPAFLFVLGGTYQMWIWAGQKKVKLVAEYPVVKRRGRLLPVRWL